MDLEAAQVAMSNTRYDLRQAARGLDVAVLSNINKAKGSARAVFQGGVQPTEMNELLGMLEGLENHVEQLKGAILRAAEAAGNVIGS